MIPSLSDRWGFLCKFSFKVENSCIICYTLFSIERCRNRSIALNSDYDAIGFYLSYESGEDKIKLIHT